MYIMLECNVCKGDWHCFLVWSPPKFNGTTSVTNKKWVATLSGVASTNLASPDLGAYQTYSVGP